MTDDMVFVRKKDWEEVVHTLQLILPMAKGYAYKNQVGNNLDFIKKAEAELEFVPNLPTLDLKAIIEGMKKIPEPELEGIDEQSCWGYNTALDDLLKKLGGKE